VALHLYVQPTRPHSQQYIGFLHHITKGSPLTKNILRQKEEKRQRPKTITKTQVQTLLDACSNQRDRLLVRLLYESAMRVGEVLSLYVEDVDVSENRLHVCDRGPLVGQPAINLRKQAQPPQSQLDV
jgi:integrase/recombinase XerD